jgi:hypothetical protein
MHAVTFAVFLADARTVLKLIVGLMVFHNALSVALQRPVLPPCAVNLMYLSADASGLFYSLDTD